MNCIKYIGWFKQKIFWFLIKQKYKNFQRHLGVKNGCNVSNYLKKNKH